MRPADAYKAAMRDVIRGGLAAGAVGFFVNLLHLAMPLYTIQIYDRVLSSRSMETLTALVLLIAVVLAFQLVLDVLRQRIFAILGGRLTARLGRPVFEAAVETTLRDGPGLAAGSVRDLADLRAFVVGGAIALPLDLAMTPLFLFVLFLLHPAYGMVGLAGATLLTAAALGTEFIVRRPSARAAAANGMVQAETTEAMRNAEVITAMGMLPDLARRWRRTQGQAIETVERGLRIAKTLSALVRTVRMAFQIGIITTGAILVINDATTAGTIIAASVLTGRLLLPFEQLVEGWRQWVDAFAAAERLRNITEGGAADRATEGFEIASGRLSVDRLTYVPGADARPVLRNVTCDVGAGELLGIVGPSGAGKSTLARMLVGIWKPTAGGVYLDGQSTWAHERSSFGRAVGYLPQEPSLFTATVAENIARFGGGEGGGEMERVVAAARAAGVHELIGSLPQGYATRIGGSGVQLSGGQKQRVALARALYGEPRLLVLDEPNSSLDADGEAALVAAIEAAQARGTTVVVVAQRMSILNRADRLLVLKDGAVAQFGPRAEVIETMTPRRVGGPSPPQTEGDRIVSLATWDDPELRPYGPVLLAALLVAAAFVATVGGWAMFARLDAAIVSYGTVHADSERKTVEHLEGGILAELLVRAGDRVAEGQVVARLDATQTRELIAQLDAELTAARFAIWRLEAERDGTTPDPAAAPDLGSAALRQARIAEETALHDARLGAHRSQVTALERQIDQRAAEANSATGRVRAAERQLALWEEERGQTAELVAKGAAPRQRLLEFDRFVAEVTGDRDEESGRAEAARQEVAGARSQIQSLEGQRRVEIVTALVENRKAVEGLEAQLRAATDALARHELRAPQAGRVIEIATVTPGAVVSPAEPLMTILPEQDELVALTRLPPSAIDSVHAGGPAQVRLTAYKRAGSPIVPGTVAYVSADALTDEAGEAYFEARVTIDAAAVADLPGIALLPGMPVEVTLTIGERRAGDYFVEPLLRRFGRALREE